MHSKTRNALLQRSFSTDLIDKIDGHGHTVENLAGLTLKQLRAIYSESEVDLINVKIRRQPIDEAVVERILEASEQVCAHCADGNGSRPFEIHHITPYASTQDNSEENLLLVCPTHHTAIHARKDSAEDQKRRRREWYAQREIAREYVARGVPFPFHTLVPIDFSGAPRPEELLSVGAPSPATARAVSRHPLASQGEARLRVDNFVVLRGGSGSGKSTLAMAVAGGMDGVRVFRYRPPHSDSRAALTEIMTLISTATKPTVLILDDMNTWSSAEDVEALRKAATATVRLVTTFTNDRASDTRVERGGASGRIVITWQGLKESVREYFMKNEALFVNALRARRTRDVRPVGLGYHDRPLASLLDEYLPKAATPWQFAFLLGAGWNGIESELAELIAFDRADVPVLVAAVEQIAGVEKPVSIDESVEATNVALPGAKAKASSAWVAEIFDRLVARNLMVSVRDRYTTVHRAWARALICSALTDPVAGMSTRALLSKAFDTKQPRRVAILITWLREEAAGFEFIHEWAADLGPEGWRALVAAAAARGLVDVALLASELHLLLRSSRWTETVGDAFATNQAAISGLVRKAGPNDWSWLRRLFMTMDHACPSTSARILEGWEPKAAAAALVNASPSDWDDADWFFGGVAKHSDPWCAAVGRELGFGDFLKGLAGAADMRSIVQLPELLMRLHVPLRRSQLRALWSVLGQVFGSAKLSQLRMWGPTDFTLELFPEDVTAAVGALDPARLADELLEAKPASWGMLLDLTHIAARARSDFPTKLAAQFDERLFDRATELGPSFPYELRLLLWQFRFLADERKEAVAAKLYPAVLLACRNAPAERESLLRAYASISLTRVPDLARELGIDPPDTSSASLLLMPFREVLDKESAKRLARLEESTADYELRAIFASEVNVEPSS